ncbi:hypothetical protein [Desulfoplanes formicivorans]|uniref:Uncharacterized protein n=1 Tax=Desulfoplanes formicivorans TaxID=1592317 RepID=A0A194AL17_9BACT|nr:hypothetical protein [Desulfoplanes formicivorans]GAU09736.1 hypothetical protein DPF_2468 [Desulfoplanes formicivorans]
MIAHHLLFSQAALAAMLLLLFAGFWGCPFIALVCEMAGRMTKRIFLDKLAQQMARLGVLIHTGIWLGCVAGGAVLWHTHPESLALTNPLARFLLSTLGLGLVGTGLLIAYFTTWKQLKKDKKPIHIIMGLVGFVLIKPLFWVPALMVRNLFVTTSGQILPAIPPAHSLFWPIGVQWAFMAITLTAVLGSLYLLIRRYRDDFGRDYYKFALPVCAKWALFPVVADLATCAWIAALVAPAIQTPDMTSLWAALALRELSLIVCIIIWVVIMKTATPLRFKGMILASGLFAWTFLVGSVATLWEILGRYTGVYVPHSFVGDLLTYLGLS